MSDLLRKALQMLESGEPVAVCSVASSQGSTPRRAGARMLVFYDGSNMDTIGGGEMEARVVQEAVLAMQDGQPRTLAYSFTDPQRGDPGVCGGQVEVFVDPWMPVPTLLVVGLGHVGKAVVHLGGWLGFRVVASDDRAEFCNPQATPGADVYLPVALADLPTHMPINHFTYVLLTTRGVNVDVAGLPAILETQPAYLGVIGSRRRWATARKQLLEAGISESALDAIHSPMGLELNAETPEEIAVSMLAEIIAIRRGGSGHSMTMKS